MENNTKARLLYVLQLLEKYSVEEHPLTTADLLSMLMEKYGIEWFTPVELNPEVIFD